MSFFSEEKVLLKLALAPMERATVISLQLCEP